jgi:prepilin-type N-terminal cleavage/methylation domain-containing protein
MRPHGFSLPEVLIACVIVGFLAALGIPATSEVLAQAAIRTACYDVVTVLTRARAEAVFRGTDVGVKFVPAAGDVIYTLYADGNGNGVTSSDIASGTDPLVAGPYSMRKKYPRITFSFLSWFSGPDPNGDPILNLGDPIKFGRGSICTFSPRGTASPGTVYLANGKDRQSLVRVSPTSSRIMIWDWQPAARKWVRRW